MTDTVLVAGGAGYIGSHCCALLAERGWLPVALDNLSTGWKAFARFGPLEVGDLRDSGFLDAVMARHKPVAAMHFAALIDVGASVRDPLAYYDNNVGATLALLGACTNHGVRNLVFSSSAAVYGESTAQPVPLSAPLAPANPYGASKAMAETAIRDVAAADGGFGATSLRYFNAAGATPDIGIGERHEPETHLIPNALAACAGGEPMRVFGDDYPSPDGTCVRDYIHVRDLAAAHVACLTHPPAAGEARAFNLGTGHGASVREIIAAIGAATGRPVPVTNAPRRAGDVATLVAGDVAVAAAALDWRPEFSELERIVADAWVWHKRLEAWRAGGSNLP